MRGPEKGREETYAEETEKADAVHLRYQSIGERVRLFAQAALDLRAHLVPRWSVGKVELRQPLLRHLLDPTADLRR